MQKELVALKINGVWNDVYNPRPPNNINTTDDSVLIEHLRKIHNGIYSNCEFIIEDRDMYVLLPDGIILTPLNLNNNQGPF